MTFKLPSVHELPHQDAITEEQRIERDKQRERVRLSLVLDSGTMRDVYPNRKETARQL